MFISPKIIKSFSSSLLLVIQLAIAVFFVDDLIVLLGTGIAGGDGVHSVETTLFQSFVNNHDEFRIRPSTQLIDPAGNGYYVPDTSNLKVFKGEQQSYRQNGKTPSKGHYAVAWLDYGIKPRDASYEVAILVRGADTISRLAENPESYYRVVNRTNALHQVYFPATRMSAIVFFEPVQIDHPVIVRASESCMVMCRQMPDNRIRLGVANPDLGFLDTDAPLPTFRFISQNENQYLPSRPLPVQIVLRGDWRTLAPARDVTIISTSNGQSILRFNCLHGMSVQTELVGD